MADIIQLNDMTNKYFELSKEIKRIQDMIKVFVYDIENHSNAEEFKPYIPKDSVAQTLESLTVLRKDLFESELKIQKEIEIS